MSPDATAPAAMTASSATSWVVLKFGGTSVSAAQHWQTIASQIDRVRQDGGRPVVVCSALAGVSNQLEALPTRALKGDIAPTLEALRAQHRALATALQIELPEAVLTILDEIERRARGISLMQEASPRSRAWLLAQGELLSTHLGHAWLVASGRAVAWHDARTLLTSAEPASEVARTWLSAYCGHHADPEVEQRLLATPADAWITQGFLAADPQGQTVVLGRGGSDTTAALLAARLQARACEIWTDVPGLFTANPRQVPEARLLRQVDYDEAQELATTGAKVLHPRCIPPVRAHQIPLFVRSTLHPALPGTQICEPTEAIAAQVKAISTKTNVTLVSMETFGMWQQVGFLADIFGVFRTHGLSIDLVSTSEINVTVSLDVAANATNGETLERLLRDLAPYCRATLIENTAAVSLVGSGIRSVLHRLGGVFKQFEEQPIHLLSQAANDLNLTVVVDAERAEGIVRRLHAELFPPVGASPIFGPSWRELFGDQEVNEVSGAHVWWRAARERLLALAATHGACFVYSGAEIAARAAALAALPGVQRALYAVKANNHPAVLRLVADAGLGFECVSIGEIDHVLSVVGPLPADRLLFTPNFAPRAEYEAAFVRGATVTLDNLHPLQHWPEVFAGREVFVRVDPGRGQGHHAHVRTAGVLSKFGIEPAALPHVRTLAAQVGTRIVGLHAHAGSGIRTPDTWLQTAAFLANVAADFPDVRVLDVGGGLGVPEQPGQNPLDLQQVGQTLVAFHAAHPQYDVWIEPGRWVVAHAGVLLAPVTQCKTKDGVTWIGTATGMNSLIRPALYGAYHDIVNLTHADEPTRIVAHVVGPVCETGDVFGRNRRLAPSHEGDILLIATAGAYGRTMSSNYNLRAPAVEIFLE